MVDRQDIDALLISALYGELTPADEARLTTHLESHPGDKSALADLTRTRATVLESRFLTVQLEPPQAVSAVLLQEATARRKAVAVAAEPVAKEGWFHRFIGSFARHPAMAAAAMLVVVVGVAGTMYIKNGGKDAFVDQSTSSFDRGGEAAPTASAPAIAEQAKHLESAAGSSYEAQLADPHSGWGADKAGKADDSEKPTDAPKVEAKKDSVVADTTINRKLAPRTYIRSEPTKNEPMELDATSSRTKNEIAAPDGNASRGAGGAPGAAPRKTPNVVVVEGRSPPAADPSPPAVKPSPQTVKGAARGGTVTGDDQARDRDVDAKVVDQEAQWARDQHVRVTNAVKANNCKEATTLAVALSNRAPAYYQQNVENDRSLKQCMTYINAERDKENERQQRARALQKRQADEADRAKRAAPPAATSK